MASLRQIRANQLNALKSAGPATPEGKAVARRNALKHGLAGTGIVLPEDEAEAINARWAQWQSSLKPDNAFSDWLVERVAALAVRLERCEHHERALLEIGAARAGGDWELECRLAAETLGEALPKAPSRVALELRRSAAGRDWLRLRWEGLGAILDVDGAWDEPRRSLALDLLGTPLTLRAGSTRADADAPALRALVAAEVAELRAMAADGTDDAERTAAELGFGPVDRELALVRRYTRSLTRQLTEFHKQVKSAMRPYDPPGTDPLRSARPPDHDRAPAPAPAAEAGHQGGPGRADSAPAIEPPGPRVSGEIAAELAETRTRIDALIGGPVTPQVSAGGDRGQPMLLGAPPVAPPANRKARRAAEVLSRVRCRA